MSDDVKPSTSSLDGNDDILILGTPRLKPATSSSDIDVITLDDDGAIPLPEDEMDIQEVHNVDAALDQEDTPNGGANPEFDRKLINDHIKRLKKKALDIYETTKDKIRYHYAVNLQSPEILRWKDNARLNLEGAARSVFPSLRLFAVGSTMNGCGSYNSDMDLCAIISPEDFNQNIESGKTQILEALRRFKSAIIRQVPSVDRVLVIKAVVPILQVTFRGAHHGLECDINVNNVAGIYNTHLIHHYALIDDRFPAFCLLIKHWALKAGINSAQEGTFNSYSLILLVLHYMQCVCTPPILPNLQEVCPNVFNGDVPLEQLKFFVNEYTFDPENKHDDFTDLLIGFFTYYHFFDFNKYVISIRKARVFSRSILPKEVNNKYAIYIEEPFDHNNTARCVRAEGLAKIRHALTSAYRIWSKPAGKPSLAKIGIDLPPTS